MIRAVNNSDVPFIKEIYNYYIKNTTASFEEHEKDESEIFKRIEETTKNYPWIVCEEDNIVKGYAYAVKWKERSAYKYSSEITIYVEKKYAGQGIGSKLLKDLTVKLKQKGIHLLIAGIALPNDASIALHEKMGFRKCAHFKEVGFKFGKWVDAGYWELLL